MSQSINLIPQQEKVEQQKVKIVRASSVLAVLVLVVVIALSAFFFYQTYSLKKAIASLDSSIQMHRQDINQLQEIEVIARETDAKYQIIKEIYREDNKYSVLANEIQARTPEGVVVSSVSFTGDNNETISITGSGVDYLAVARFINTLSDVNFANSPDAYKAMFLDVTLNSVTLDTQKLNVSYFIVAKVNQPLLKRVK